jgi:hypothetical protein
MRINHSRTHKLTGKKPNNGGPAIPLLTKNPHRFITRCRPWHQMGYFASFAGYDGIVVAADTQCAWGGGIDEGPDNDNVGGRTMGEARHDGLGRKARCRVITD